MPARSRWPARNARGNQQRVRPGRAQHEILASCDPPAVARARGLRRDVVEGETRLRLGLREGEYRLAVGNGGKHVGFLLLRAEPGNEACGDHGRRQIWLDHQRPPERFHDNAGFDGTCAKPAELFRNGQPEPAEIGKLAPDVAAETFSGLQDGATLLEGIPAGDEAACRVAEQPLFFGKREIHRSSDRGLKSQPSLAGTLYVSNFAAPEAGREPCIFGSRPCRTHA